MTYYRVCKEYDNKTCNNGKWTMIGNELYTKKETEKHAIPQKALNEVQVSKSRIYWFFGARFEEGVPHTT